MNQFDFSSIPESFHFYYVDSQGHQWIAQKRPIKTPFGWMPIPVSQHDVGYQPFGEQISPDFWEESLQQRPVTVEWLRSIGFKNDSDCALYGLCERKKLSLIIAFVGDKKEFVSLKDEDDNDVVCLSIAEIDGCISREKILHLLAAFGHEKQ